MTADTTDRGPIHGAVTTLVKSRVDLDLAFKVVESGRSVLVAIVGHLNRPFLDELTEQLVDRARGIGATVTHVGSPGRYDPDRRRRKRLAVALGNHSFIIVPASPVNPDVQVRRLPTQKGDERTVVGSPTVFNVGAVE